MPLVIGGVVLALFLVILVAMVFRFGGSTVARLSNNRRQATSMKNLQQIAKALNAYAADYGTYPPPMTTDSKGTVMHSWRVLILPYLGEKDLYAQFDLNKPWNDPVNSSIGIESQPSVYIHPESNTSGYVSGISYCLITGPGTLFPPTGPLGPTDVGDKPSQTLLVVDGNPSGIGGIGGWTTWTTPADLDITAMQGMINGAAGIEPGGLFTDGATAVTVDERPHFLKNSMPTLTFDALITPNGGEPIKDDTLD